MPAADRYAFKIVDDLTGDFEYSPPFGMTVPGSTFGGGQNIDTSTSSPAPQTSTAPRTSSTSTTSTREVESTTSTSTTSTPEPTEAEETSSTSTSTRATRTPTATPTSTPEDDTPSAPSQPVIIGIVVAAVVIIAFIVFGIILCTKRRRKAADRDSIIGDGLGPAYGNNNIPINNINTPQTIGGTPYGKQAFVSSQASLGHNPNPFAEPKGAYRLDNESQTTLQNPFAEPVARTRSREDNFDAGYGYASSNPQQGYARSQNNGYTTDGYNPYGNKF